MGFSYYFKKIDFFAKEFTFEDSSNTKFKTPQGAVISLIAIVTSIALAIMFGRELFERKIPIVTQNKQRIENSEINLKEFPFFIFFAHFSGMPYSEFDKYFDIIGLTFHFDNNTNVSFSLFEMKKCEEIFNQYNNSSVDLIKDLYVGYPRFCADFLSSDISFSNDWASPNSQFQKLEIRTCVLGRETDHFGQLRNTPCEYDPNKSMDSLVAGISYTDTYIDSNSYDNPIKFEAKSQLFSFAPGILQKVINFFVTNNIYKSDDGWLLENYREIHYLQVGELGTDSTLISESDSLILYFTFASRRLRTQIVRNYTKIQDLFAKIGGIANSIVIVLHGLTYYYLRFNYLLFIGKNSVFSNNTTKTTYRTV